MLRPSDGALARFTRDLTADARAGHLDPIRCRAAEIDRVVDVLLRRDKNNPVLVGEAGVGKTAIAEGLAQRLAEGQVPLSLRGLRVLALDHVGLLAGAMYRGQYEERLQGIVEETKRAGDVILFIDELHNLVGQGTAMGVAMDAANMLKPALARGEFRVLGATTQQEYDRWIRGDPALERRFQPVLVRELSADETLDVMQSRRDQLETHHHVVIADAALLASVRLTDLFMTDRRRPDRAIDVLDEACAHAHAMAHYAPETVRLIARVTGRSAPTERADAGEAESEQESAPRRDHEPEQEDTIENFARDGVAALERFGAELDAMFGVAPAPERGASRRRAPAPNGARSATAASRTAAAEHAAEWRAELRRRLMEEGAVVRGHDIARVVGLITGKTVTWVD